MDGCFQGRILLKHVPERRRIVLSERFPRLLENILADLSRRFDMRLHLRPGTKAILARDEMLGI